MILSLRLCLLALFSISFVSSAFAEQNSESRYFVSVDLGVYTRADNAVPNNNLLFDYGVKFGMSAADLGFSKLGVALTFDRNRRSVDFGTSSNAHEDLNNIDAQILLLNIEQTGIYAGAIAGVVVTRDAVSVSSQDSGVTGGAEGSQTSTYFTAGATAGFDVPILDCLAIGPEVRYQHIFGNPKANDLRFLGDVTYRF